MCGIVYSKSFNGRSVVPTIVERYKAQRHRGTNGFGFFLPASNRLTHNVKEGRILSLLKHREDESEVLFHHRFPTSTANVRNACHPFSTKDVFENNYVVVHNGVLRNESELKKKHDTQGIGYVSLQDNGRYNDSEALAYDVAQYLEGFKDTIDATGSIAFIAIKRDKAGKPVTLFFARNSSSPLKMKRTRFSLTLSSEGEGELVDTNTLYSMSYDTLEITKRPCVIGTGWTSYNSGYTGGHGTGYHAPRPSLAPASSYHAPFNDFDDEDDELMGLGFTPPDEDFDDYEYKSAHQSEVNSMVQSFMYESNEDVVVALALAKEALLQYQARQLQLDLLSQDEELANNVGHEEVNEYCGNEDKILYIEEAIKVLRSKLTAQVIKEASGERTIGFHQQPYTGSPQTGTRHTVPSYNTEVKTLGTGDPKSDKGDTE